jgi:hypothetical protein
MNAKLFVPVIAAIGFAFGYAAHTMLTNALFEFAPIEEMAQGQGSTTPSGYTYASVPVCNENGFCLRLVNALGLLPDASEGLTSSPTDDPLPRYLPQHFCTRTIGPGDDIDGGHSDFMDSPLYEPLRQMHTEDYWVGRGRDAEDFCHTILRESTFFEVVDSRAQKMLFYVPLSDSRMWTFASQMGISELGNHDLRLDGNNDIVWNTEARVTCSASKGSYRIKYEMNEYGDGSYANELTEETLEESSDCGE